MIKENKNEQITAGLLADVAQEVRIRMKSEMNSIVNKISGGKEVMLAVEKKIKSQLRRIRVLWDDNFQKAVKLNEKLK